MKELYESEQPSQGYRVIVTEGNGRGKGQHQEAYLAQVWFDANGNPIEWAIAEAPKGYAKGYAAVAVDNLQEDWEKMAEAFSEEVYMLVTSDSGQFLEII